ncbi:MAG: TraB/VirB10 family protein [Syntrophorhabdales bacterium]
MTLKEKAEKIWQTLKPEQKKKLTFLAIALVIVVLSLLFYKATRGSSTQAVKPTEGKREVSLDKGTLEKSLYSESTRQMADLQAELKAMKEQMALEKKPEKDDAPDLAKELLKQAKQDKEKDKEKVPMPRTSISTPPPVPPPPPPKASYPPGDPPMPAAPQAAVKPEVYGDIEFVSQPVKKEEESKKKVGMKIYLPPSFMEATLLSGMYAPTTQTGKDGPMPALLRIKNLAVLPNSVKSDLKGCFVMVEAHGSLGGQSVIDQKIKGYIVDEDGFVGLRGKVVSKMGAAIARSLVAGFAVGFGDALNASAITTTVSGLGVTQTLDTDRAVKAGAGRGVSQAGRDLQRFLLDLGKQAIPVVEVAAMRPVTIVISEGVEIEVKEIPNTCIGGTDTCGN